MSDYLWRESVPLSQATPTQRRLAQEHAERMKRWLPTRSAPRRPAPEPIETPPSQPAPAPDPTPLEVVLKLALTRPGVLTARLIIDIVAMNYNMNRLQLLSRQRTLRVVRPRQIAIYLACEMLHGASLSEVARWFGGFDHTTIMHARERIGELMRGDPDAALEIAALRKQILNASSSGEAANDNRAVA